MTTPSADLSGSLVEVDVGPVAHGGHFVARHEGRVIFVRHAIPGERVIVRITEGAEDSRFLRGDAVEVLQPSADRVPPPCPYAGPGACGGCDFQHVALPRQRELLGEVVREQLRRLAGQEFPVTVEPVPGDHEGLGWRTRVRFTASVEGRPGLLRHRSHEVEEVEECLIAVPDLPDVGEAIRAGAEWAEAVATSAGDHVVVTDVRSAPVVTEHAIGRSWRVNAGDFWQVHPGAADVLVSAVLDGVQAQPGERCWDLYSGVGLLSAALARAVGHRGKVLAVESHRRAVENARTNLADLPQVRLVFERVDRFVRGRSGQGRVDVIVLDPPRSGAGRAVIKALAARDARVLAYVACDPAALARDLGYLRAEGYELRSLRAFDIFPMTHHVECVAVCARMSYWPPSDAARIPP